MKKIILLSLLLVLFAPLIVDASSDVSLKQNGKWATINVPGAIDSKAYGIFGDKIVGHCTVSSVSDGFLSNGKNWTVLDGSKYVPGNYVSGSYSTDAWGVFGDKVVGGYIDAFGHGDGFVYNSKNWTTLNMPGYNNTTIYGIHGDRMVGVVADPGYHGFLYDGKNWTTIDAPMANGNGSTNPTGVSKKRIVGYYSDGSGWHGFVYNGNKWTTLDAPGATNTWSHSVSGKKVVGYYRTNSKFYGFIYDGKNWTTLDAPNSYATYAYGINGNKVVGYYTDATGNHIFVYTIQ